MEHELFALTKTFVRNASNAHLMVARDRAEEIIGSGYSLINPELKRTARKALKLIEAEMGVRQDLALLDIRRKMREQEAKQRTASTLAPVPNVIRPFHVSEAN